MSCIQAHFRIAELAWLLSLNTNLLKNNALGDGRASKRLLPLVTQMALLVRIISSKLGCAMVLELLPSSHTTCLTPDSGSESNSPHRFPTATITLHNPQNPKQATIPRQNPKPRPPDSESVS
ncbi:hypothetical protein KC19_11G063500, partial [Ceratodon purpureus]